LLWSVPARVDARLQFSATIPGLWRSHLRVYL
jgi:hypothetical protein